MSLKCTDLDSVFRFQQEKVADRRFTMAAKHLDDIEVEISWFSGAWFLSLFVNVLPWESGKPSLNSQFYAHELYVIQTLIHGLIWCRSVEGLGRASI